jgi:hypothetical protein
MARGEISGSSSESDEEAGQTQEDETEPAHASLYQLEHVSGAQLICLFSHAYDNRRQLRPGTRRTVLHFYIATGST